ncbi:endonuclease [Vibrio phage vB_VpP_BA6]|nr:endonuclease [Vibrio phage vB_VpP_BA6]
MRPNRRWMQGQRKADSKFEQELKDGVLKDFDFQHGKIPYAIPHTYRPDFVKDNLIIEAKGRFRDSAEARKYLFIRDALEENQELVFLFYNPQTPMPFAKKRKDGTKQTHAEWAERNNFKWYTKETIKEIL